MIIKIAILYTENSKAQRQIIKGLGSVVELVRPAVVDFKLLCTESASESLVNKKIDEALSFRPDILVTIGDACTKYAGSYLTEKITYPVIGLAVTDQITAGVLESSKIKEQFTAIKTAHPPKVLPLQILLTLNKVIKRFIFVYKQGVHDARVEYEIEKMEEFLNSHGRFSLRAPLPKQETVAEYLSALIKEGDGVVIPAANIPKDELKPINDVCKEKKALLFAEAENVIPPNAICGYSADFEFMGRQGALYIRDLAYKNVPISETPVYEFENASQITINNNTAREHGVELYDNQMKMFTTGEGKDFLLNLKFHYDMVLEYDSAFGRRLYEKLLRSSRRNAHENLLCEPMLHINAYHEGEFTPHFCERVVATNTPCVVVQGYRMACMLQREMLKTGRFKHMFIISFADEQLEAEPALIKKNNWPVEYRVMRITLPAFDAASAVRLLRVMMPEMQSVACLYNRSPQSVEPRLQAMLADMQAACESHGLSFAHSGSEESASFTSASEKLIKDNSALFSFPMSITVDQAAELSQACYAESRFLLSGDQGTHHVHSSLLQINLKSIVDAMWDTLLIAARGGVVPPRLDLKLAFHHAYAYRLDERWFERRLKTIPDNLESLVGVPIAKEEIIDHNDDNCDGGLMSMDEILRRAQTRTFKPKKASNSGLPDGVEEVGGAIEREAFQINERLFVWYGIIQKA